MSEPIMHEDQISLTVPAEATAIRQRDALLDALRRVLPPGRWVKGVSIQRGADGTLEGAVTRETRV